jgi:hypothetical protein
LSLQVINLGNGRPFLLKDFISLVESSVGKAAMIEILPHQPGDVDRTCADISKAQELLGYCPKVPFEEGIRRTALWFRDATEEGLFDDDDNEEVGGEEVQSRHSLARLSAARKSKDGAAAGAALAASLLRDKRAAERGLGEGEGEGEEESVSEVSTTADDTERERSESVFTVASSDDSSYYADHLAMAAAAVAGAPGSGTGEGIAGGSSNGRLEPYTVLTPSRILPQRASSTSAYKHTHHVFLHKNSSDLELSSYVAKAPKQVKKRLNRLI